MIGQSSTRTFGYPQLQGCGIGEPRCPGVTNSCLTRLPAICWRSSVTKSARRSERACVSGLLMSPRVKPCVSLEKELLGCFRTIRRSPRHGDSGMLKAPEQPRAAGAGCKDAVGLRYTAPRLRRTSELVRSAREGWRPGGRVRALATLVRAGAAAVWTVLRLPTVSIVTTDSEAGTMIRARLAERRFGVEINRLGQGVLILPPEMEVYFQGRLMQALRTNVRRARNCGMEVHPLGPEDAGIVRCVLERHRQDAVRAQLRTLWWVGQLALPGNHGWAAVDATNQPVAIALVTVDDRAALLQAMVGVTYDGRWLLHTAIVEALHAQGVRHLLTYSSSALLLHPNIQQFQHLLGYTVVNISLDGGSRAARRRRHTVDVRSGYEFAQDVPSQRVGTGIPEGFDPADQGGLQGASHPEHWPGTAGSK